MSQATSPPESTITAKAETQAFDNADVEMVQSPDDLYNEEDADFTLVSSDHVSFKVYKYHLLSSSSVFRDMLECSIDTDSRNTVELTDPTIETSDTVRLYLNLLHDDIPTPCPEDLGHVRNLIAFCQKYDCAQMILAIKGYLWETIKTVDAPSYQCFILAAHLDDVQLAAEAIRYTGDWVFMDPKNPKDKARPNLEGWRDPSYDDSEDRNVTKIPGGTMQAAPWPPEELRRVPMIYWMALLKTDLKHSLAQGGDDYEEAAEYFLELMKDE
ncbi:hypothetical protein IAU60_001133 [Kwoniella sp. DSM 27419]